MNSTKREGMFKRFLENLAGYSTFHGFHFVVNSSNAAARRLIWLGLIVAATAFLFVQLISSFKKLQANRFVVDKNVIYSPDVVFPAFTFCNINMMKKSRIQGTQAQLYIDMVDRKWIGNKDLNSSFDLEKALLNAGHTAKDMVHFSRWKGKRCSYRNFTTFYTEKVKLGLGLCCV